MILAIISCQHCWDHYERDKNISEVLNCYNDLRSCEEKYSTKRFLCDVVNNNKKDMCVLLCEKKKNPKKSSIMNNKIIILARYHIVYIQIK